MLRLASLVMVLAFVLLLPGCIDPQQIALAREQTLEARDALSRALVQREALLRELPVDDPARPELEREVLLLTADRTAIDAALTRIDALLADVNDPAAAVRDLAGHVSNLLPEPLRSPLLLGVAALAALARARQLKVAARSLAGGVERLRKTDPAFSQALAAHAGELRAIQTPLAARVVDEVQGKVLRLPL